MFALAARYDAALRARPLLTKALTGLTLSGSGDVLAQYVEAKQANAPLRGRYDPRRTLVFGGFGCLWTGPVNHVWLPTLIRLFPGTSWATTAKRVAVQQLLWNPFVFMPSFFVAYGVGMGFTWDQLLAKARNEYQHSLVECWKIWVPVTLVVFRMPERLQSVTMATTNLAWNARLSWLSSETRVVAAAGARGWEDGEDAADVDEFAEEPLVLDGVARAVSAADGDGEGGAERSSLFRTAAA